MTVCLKAVTQSITEETQGHTEELCYKKEKVNQMKIKLYVQYGCGLSAPEGWQNFDASPLLLLSKIPFVKHIFSSKIPHFPSNVRYGNIIKGLPVPKASCSGLYASHVLQHLPLEDFRKALRNSYSLLLPKGIFRLVVLDLEYITKNYLSKNTPMRAQEFMQESHLGLEKRDHGFISMIGSFWGNSFHLSMWDFISLKKELEDAGFINIRRAYFNDSKDPKFREVEDESRFVDALAVECEKPG
jgi:predicted SAM-dependent methyltransferase